MNAARKGAMAFILLANRSGVLYIHNTYSILKCQGSIPDEYIMIVLSIYCLGQI